VRSGLLRVVDRRGHGDDDEVGLPELVELGGERDARGAELGVRDLAGAVVPLRELGDAALVDVEADGLELLRHGHGHGETHVPETDHPYDALDHVLVLRSGPWPEGAPG
jgi:hypothetical protein